MKPINTPCIFAAVNIAKAVNAAKPPKAIALAFSEDSQTASISIRGVIGDWWEGTTADQVDGDIFYWLPATVKNLTIRITSFGGDLAQGLAIHAALQRHPAHKVAIIEGVAASAATLIAMAADEIHIQANAAMMVHGVSIEDSEGNPLEIPEAERVLNEGIIETYAKKTGKSREDLAGIIAQDTWMTAREAVAAGFADKLIELAAPRAQAETLAAFAQASGVPAEIVARAQSEAEKEESPAPEASADTEKKDPAPAAKAQNTFAAQVNALATAAGLGDHVSAWLLDGSITTTAQAEAAIKEAREVRDLCTFANASNLAGGFIRARKTLAEVRAELIDARADKSDSSPTDSTRKRAAADANVQGAGDWNAAFAQLKTIRSM